MLIVYGISIYFQSFTLNQIVYSPSEKIIQKLFKKITPKSRWRISSWNYSSRNDRYSYRKENPCHDGRNTEQSAGVQICNIIRWYGATSFTELHRTLKTSLYGDSKGSITFTVIGDTYFVKQRFYFWFHGEKSCCMGRYAAK